MPWRRPLTWPAVVGSVLLVAAAVMLAARLPGAYHAFDNGAKAAAGRNELGGALAAADATGIDNDFVRDAFEQIPRTGSFAVVLPTDESAVEQSQNVSPTTFEALPTLLENYLLPRREVATAKPGTFILCYLCDKGAWSSRTHWLADNGRGELVGYVYRP